MLEEVNLHRQAGLLIDHYRRIYEETHSGRKPFVINISQISDALRVLIEQSSFERMQQIISFYLKSNDEWFVKQGHSLECLLKNMPALQANAPGAPRPTQTIVIRFWSMCPVCKKNIEHDAKSFEEMEDKAYIQACDECGAENYWTQEQLEVGRKIRDLRTNSPLCKKEDCEHKPASRGVMSLPSTKDLLEGW